LILVIFCNIIQIALHPSRTGIGNTLNIANAKDNIAANHKYDNIHHISYIIPPILTAQIGQANEFRASFIPALLNDTNDLPIFHNVFIVRFHSAHIS
jgi:hypothetical protein